MIPIAEAVSATVVTDGTRRPTPPEELDIDDLGA